jgi:hypothetical protein
LAERQFVEVMDFEPYKERVEVKEEEEVKPKEKEKATVLNMGKF